MVFSKQPKKSVAKVDAAAARQLLGFVQHPLDVVIAEQLSLDSTIVIEHLRRVRLNLESRYGVMQGFKSCKSAARFCRSSMNCENTWNARSRCSRDLWPDTVAPSNVFVVLRSGAKQP